MGCAASVDAPGTKTTTMATLDKPKAAKNADPKQEEEEPREGLHISAIRKFLADHPDVAAQDLTTSQTNRAVVKPESLGTGQPYIAKYMGMTTELGKPFVAPATVFISHAWRYAFASTVADVMEQHALKEPDAYFWFDLFTNDQNAVASKDFEWFSNTFKNSIREIGQVVLILSPWNDPKPIRRCWCLFEIANSLSDKDVKFTINLPRSEITAMSKAVVSDNACLVQALSDIQAEKAEAFMEEDRRMIFEVIEKTQGGFAYVNEQVKKGLREWYISELRDMVDKSPDDFDLRLTVAQVAQDFGFMDEAIEYTKACLEFVKGKKVSDNYMQRIYTTLGNLYIHKGELDLALEFQGKSLELAVRTGGEEHIDVGTTYNNIANVHHAKGDMNKSLEYYQKSLAIKRKGLGEDHTVVATSYNNIANVYQAQGDLETSLEYHEKCLAIRQKALGEHHPDIAATHNNMAIVYHKKGDFEAALESHNKSLRIKLATLGENHPDVAVSYIGIANIHHQSGNLDKALEFHEKSLEINLKVLGEFHVNVASTYYNMANLYDDVKQVDKALDYYNKTLTIAERQMGADHFIVGNCYNYMANIYTGKRELDTALEYFHKSLAIKVPTVGEDHPVVVGIYNTMAQIYNVIGQPDKAQEYQAKAHQSNQQ